MSLKLGLALSERGLLPESVTRYGIRRLLRARLREQQQAPPLSSLIDHLQSSAIALRPDKPNEQHYEVPSQFFELVLGPRLKYSGAYWPNGTGTLAEAENRMLELTCERAQIADGQEILDLGCGWGSLSLYIAEHFPNTRIVAVSNSALQRDFIETRRPANVEVKTADMNDFNIDRRFDRVVSIEMFEHMRNYRLLMHRIARWLHPTGKLFVHIFCHRRFAYPFESTGDGNWMGRYFFTAGLMPSIDLLGHFQDDLALDASWPVNGIHYARTAAAWRNNLAARRAEVLAVLNEASIGSASLWYHRWRLFFLACEELFRYRDGDEWLVAHYRFSPQAGRRRAVDATDVGAKRPSAVNPSDR